MPCSCCCSLLEEIYFPRPAPYYAFLTHIHSSRKSVQYCANLTKPVKIMSGSYFKKKILCYIFCLMTPQIFK